MIEVVTDGNVEGYSKYIVTNGLLSIKSYPYSLYIGERYNFSPGYDDVYIYIMKLDHIRRKRLNIKDEHSYPSFKALNSNERNLALYCLIKSYQKGFVQNSRVLAYYFKEGLFFRKNIEISHRLDSIYQHRPSVQ